MLCGEALRRLKALQGVVRAYLLLLGGGSELLAVGSSGHKCLAGLNELHLQLGTVGVRNLQGLSEPREFAGVLVLGGLASFVLGAQRLASFIHLLHPMLCCGIEAFQESSPLELIPLPRGIESRGVLGGFPAGDLQLLGEPNAFTLECVEPRDIGMLSLVRLGKLLLCEGDGLFERGALANKFHLSALEVGPLCVEGRALRRDVRVLSSKGVPQERPGLLDRFIPEAKESLRHRLWNARKLLCG